MLFCLFVRLLLIEDPTLKLSTGSMWQCLLCLLCRERWCQQINAHGTFLPW